MRYKLYFDAIQCNKLYSNFIRSCDLGIDAVGIPISMSFTTITKPDDEYVKKIIAKFLSTKDYKELSNYYVNVKLNRIEVLEI